MNGLSGGHCRSRLAKDECCRMPFFKCSEYYLASDKRLSERVKFLVLVLVLVLRLVLARSRREEFAK
jgi:hypothetical protein